MIILIRLMQLPLLKATSKGVKITRHSLMPTRMSSGHVCRRIVTHKILALSGSQKYNFKTFGPPWTELVKR